MKNCIKILVLLLLAIPHLGTSQDSLINDQVFAVSVNYPYISISKEELALANTLDDLNEKYKSEWVREYLSVEIMTIENGKKRITAGKNETLNAEQKKAMRMADSDKDIYVGINYIPENTLKDNPPRMEDFKFSINPDTEASFPGGEPQLSQYFIDKVMGHIPNDFFTGYKLTAFKFTINEEGHITNSHMFWSSEDEKIDALILDAICSMPDWRPAEYSDGTKVKQEFVFTIGNMKNCAVNLLNIQ